MAGTLSLSAAPLKTFTVKTASLAIELEVREDGRLYQRPIGAAAPGQKPDRVEESYPQASDGYIWEPALQVVHTDGNTSTSLRFENSHQIEEAQGRQLLKIQLKDPAYPLETTWHPIASRIFGLIMCVPSMP